MTSCSRSSKQNVMGGTKNESVDNRYRWPTIAHPSVLFKFKIYNGYGRTNWTSPFLRQKWKWCSTVPRTVSSGAVRQYYESWILYRDFEGHLLYKVLWADRAIVRYIMLKSSITGTVNGLQTSLFCPTVLFVFPSRKSSRTEMRRTFQTHCWFCPTKASYSDVYRLYW